MKKFLCDRCKEKFDESELGTLETSYERQYDVHTGTITVLSLAVCPNCGSEDFDEIEVCHVCEEATAVRMLEEEDSAMCEKCYIENLIEVKFKLREFLEKLSEDELYVLNDLFDEVDYVDMRIFK